MSFLTAEWRKLLLANYVIDPDILRPYVPAKTELDLWQGKCYVSLVGFMFVDTRLLGIKIPFHTSFEEVNLRFYVKHFDGDAWKRGVVFLKEIVPKPALSWVANLLYKEHYRTHPMKHQWEEQGNQLKVSYAWKAQKEWQNFSATTLLTPSEIAAGSEAEFITEHYWGYTRVSETKTFEYQVTHPRWQQYRVEEYDIAVDFGAVYGDEFALLNQQAPNSVMLAEGSKITVEGKRKI